MTAFVPEATGVLDDHIESWFLSLPEMPARAPEGFETVMNLGLGEEWLAQPMARPSDESPARGN